MWVDWESKVTAIDAQSLYHQRTAASRTDLHMDDTIIGETDSGRAITFRVGDVFRIELAESPTTGYRWEIHVDEPATVEVRDSSFTSSGVGVGGGGLRAFTLVAKGKGMTRVRGVLRRSWEAPQPPISAVEFVIDVPS